MTICFSLLLTSEDPLPDRYFDGYCFQGSDFIVGEAGLAALADICRFKLNTPPDIDSGTPRMSRAPMRSGGRCPWGG